MAPRLIPLGLAAASYLLALVQRPGTTVADTKVDLYTDPGSFLGDVASAWSPTGQLGHVFGGQYGGYLFPMGPWFALGDLLGLPDWLVHRLWLGTMLALAAWGVVRLLDALLDRPRGVPHVAAAVLYVLNPYVAVYANRISVALLAFAALPWLLLAVHRGLRSPHGWRWPALFALVLTCTGGGVNVAVTGWILLAPLLLVAYERLFGGVPRRAVLPFAARLIPLTALANAWWVVPVLAHARYGLDFLPFTEQPGTIWQTTSIPEALRLMSFWTSYIGLGFGGLLRPYASHGPVLNFEPVVVVASLLVPALVLLGFAWTRRWRYGPWFLLLTLVGLLVMVAGFPEGTPLRRALTFTYNHVEAVQFLRTTYKAGPLVALGLACLGGAAFGVLWTRLRSAGPRAAAAAGALALCAVAAWPLTSGTAPERQLAFDVPRWWDDAAAAVDRLPADRRAMVLPGQLFAFYDWGGTWDPILPALTDRPVAERWIVPFSDLRAIDLMWATDALVSQERLLPGQLRPLLDLMAVGMVVTPADGDRSRSGAVGALEAADVLRREPWLSRAARALGPRRLERAAAGRVRAPERLPRVRLAPVGGGSLVRLLPRAAATIVDGGGEGIAELAAYGGVDARRPLSYAGDLDAGALRRAAADPASELVITDTNRRRAFTAARLRANTGPTLPPDQDVSEDGTMLNPFEDRGPDAQTVARITGVASVSAPASPQVTQFPEHRPFAAIDGDRRTAWLADRALSRSRHVLTVRLPAPRAVGHVDVLPYGDRHGVVRRIAVNGRELDVGPGWTRVELGGTVDRVEVRLVGVVQPGGITGGAGGIRELRIPGMRAGETLRPPVLVERALASPPVAGGVRAGLTYLLSRTTLDAPSRSGPPSGPFQSYLVRDRVDPEPVLRRTIAPPVARWWAADGWASPQPAAADSALDDLAGASGGARIDSSGRYRGRAAFRGSGAFDGTRARAWIAPWLGDRPATLTVARDEPFAIRRLRLVPPRDAVRLPTRVRLRAGRRPGPVLAVGPGGVVEPPRPLRTARLTLEVLDARFPARTPGRERQRRAVGIGEVLGVPGARMRLRRRGPLRGTCTGDAGVAAGRNVIALRATGDVAAFERGDPIRVASCSVPQSLPAGRVEVEDTGIHPLRIDHLRLRSGAPGGPQDALAGGGLGRVAPPPAAGRVLDPGRPGRGSRHGIRLAVSRPGWLVYGEGYNRGWRATCDGRDLGAPVPLQGYANAWPVEPGCTAVDVSWAPNRSLLPAYLVSLLACLVLVAVAIRRPRDAPESRPLGALPDDDAPHRWPVRAAIAAGLAAGVVLGFVFGIRAGVVVGPGVALILWRGLSARRLALTAGALLGVVVPVLYLAVPARDPGGYNTNLAVERIAAHWVGVAGVVVLMLALWRTLRSARSA